MREKTVLVRKDFYNNFMEAMSCRGYFKHAFETDPDLIIRHLPLLLNKVKINNTIHDFATELGHLDFFYGDKDTDHSEFIKQRLIKENIEKIKEIFENGLKGANFFFDTKKESFELDRTLFDTLQAQVKTLADSFPADFQKSLRAYLESDEYEQRNDLLRKKEVAKNNLTKIFSHIMDYACFYDHYNDYARDIQNAEERLSTTFKRAGKGDLIALPEKQFPYKISQSDFGRLCFLALSYSSNRKTGIHENAVRYMNAHWSELSQDDRQKINSAFHLGHA